MSTHRALLALVVSLSLPAFACTVKTTGTDSPSSTDGGAPKTGGGTTKTPGTSSDTKPTGSLTCKQVVDCLRACAANDDRCQEACGEKASQDAATKLTALGDCIDASACEDEACVEQACGAEMRACMGQ